jgi:hypothetical protein
MGDDIATAVNIGRETDIRPVENPPCKDDLQLYDAAQALSL